MPVYFILIRKQESSPGLWCCGRSSGMEKATLTRKGVLDWVEGMLYHHRFHEVLCLSGRELYQLIKIQFADWIAMIGVVPRPPSRDPGPGKNLLFLDEVDELRLLCEEHTEYLLRLCRARPMPLLPSRWCDPTATAQTTTTPFMHSL